MERFNLPLVAEGLTAYAIERQNGFERHQPDGVPPWAEQRRFWTDAVLQGMARLEGREPDMTLIARYDHELEQARGALTSPASPRLQNDTVRELRSFVSALAASGDDRRQQISAVRDLLEDMASHLPWAGTGKTLDHARDEADRALVRMTSQMPIRFSHIFMGGDTGPWASGFVSGCVCDPEAVNETSVYQDAAREYTDIQNWVTLCVTYVGRGLPSALGAVDASAFDLEIMNRAGDSFLKEQGIRWLSGPYQMTIAAEPVQSQDEPVSLNMGLTM